MAYWLTGTHIHTHAHAHKSTRAHSPRKGVHAQLAELPRKYTSHKSEQSKWRVRKRGGVVSSTGSLSVVSQRGRKKKVLERERSLLPVSWGKVKAPPSLSTTRKGITLPGSGDLVELQHKTHWKMKGRWAVWVCVSYGVQSACSKRTVQIWSLAFRAFLPG